MALAIRALPEHEYSIKMIEHFFKLKIRVMILFVLGIRLGVGMMDLKNKRYDFNWALITLI